MASFMKEILITEKLYTTFTEEDSFELKTHVITKCNYGTKIKMTSEKKGEV